MWQVIFKSQLKYNNYPSEQFIKSFVKDIVYLEMKLNSLVLSSLLTAWAAFKYHLKNKINMIMSTAVGINVHGSASAFRTRTLAMKKYIWIISSILRGSISSIEPMSFENLLRTRPTRKKN